MVNVLNLEHRAAGFRLGSPRRWAGWVPGALTYFLVVLLAYMLAGLTWAVVDVIFPAVNTGYSPVTGAGSPVREPDNGVGNVAWQELALFGTETKRASVPVARKAKPARRPAAAAGSLRLKLYGTVVSSDPDKSLAVVSADDKPADVYSVGAELQSGVVLKEVKAWSVVVSSRGEDQVVSIIEDSQRRRVSSKSRSALPVPQPAAYAGETRISAPSVVKKLQGYRDELDTNPAELMDKIRASSVQRDGERYGWRVRPGADRALLGQLGLRSGDILISLNGIPLNDIASFSQVVDQLKTQQEFVLDLERGGNRQELRVVMDGTGAN